MQRFLTSLRSNLGPLLALLLVIAFFAAADRWQDHGGGFATVRNAQNVMVQTATVAVAALGMTLIITSGGIDLSAGTGMALCSVVLAWFLQDNYPPWLAVSLSVMVGCLIGLLNGLLITTLRVVPFIVTLGTMTIYLGLAKLIANNQTIRPEPNQVPEWTRQLLNPRSDSSWLLLPPGIWILLALAILVILMMRFTILGRHIMAIGGNESAARECGIRVEATRVLVYTIAGFTIGIAGLLHFARLSTANPATGFGKELLMIAAVIIGGASLSGGRGSIVGTLMGALIMQVIANGCNALRLKDPIQEIIIGTIIVTAVTVDRYRQRRLRR